MALLSLLVEKSLKEKKFFDSIKTRLEEHDMVKNPFTGRMTTIHQTSQSIVLLLLEPLYPMVIPLAGLFLSFVGLLFGWKVLFIGGLLIASLVVFWSARFFFFMLKRGRKKAGLTGKIKLLSHKDALLVVMDAWDK